MNPTNASAITPNRWEELKQWVQDTAQTRQTTRASTKRATSMPFRNHAAESAPYVPCSRIWNSWNSKRSDPRKRTQHEHHHSIAPHA